MKSEIILIGAGGHALSCIDVIETHGLYRIAGLVGLPAAKLNENTASISSALDRMYSKSFQESLETVTNPYGVGGATAQTLMVLESIPLDGMIKKKFHDLGVKCG